MSWEAFRRIPLWKDVPLEDWETYQWQMANRIQTVEQLRHVIRLTPSEEVAVTRKSGRFIMAIPPYWAALMDPDELDVGDRLQLAEHFIQPFVRERQRVAA